MGIPHQSVPRTQSTELRPCSCSTLLCSTPRPISSPVMEVLGKHTWLLLTVSSPSPAGGIAVPAASPGATVCTPSKTSPPHSHEKPEGVAFGKRSGSLAPSSGCQTAVVSL